MPHLRYEQHTWPELAELAARDDVVVVIPTATLEDHGHHLPIDTDVRLIEEVARGACERVNAAGGTALLFPTAVHGYTPHHLHFPGTVTLRWNVFVEYLLDLGRSLCHHGFDRILMVNGHGSNQPLVDIAARLVNVEHPAAICASCWYLVDARVQATARGVARVGPRRHGARLRARDVALSRDRARARADAEGGQGDPAADGVHVDGLERRPALVHAALERALAVGRHGRRDRRHGREGRRWLARAQDEIAGFIAEVRDRPHPQPVDHH